MKKFHSLQRNVKETNGNTLSLKTGIKYMSETATKIQCCLIVEVNNINFKMLEKCAAYHRHTHTK